MTGLETGFDPIGQERSAFWSDFERVLEKNAPPEDFVLVMNNKVPVWLHNATVAAQTPRPEIVDVSYKNFDKLNETHHAMVKSLPELAAKIPFARNTSGIVFTTFKDDLDVLLVSLKMLRRSKTTLPVEVFLDSPEDNENYFCERVLPEMNAKCLYYSDFFGVETIKKFDIKTYEYKVLSILFSSFENVLFLDTDNIVVSNLDEVLSSPPFTEYGLVVWTDFWTETVSQVIFDITDRTAPENLTHASSESGQLMFSKTLQGESLLLAVYYNMYGHGQYYKLFAQNCWGEGDKDTFHNAAASLGKPYYRLNTMVEQMNAFKTGNFTQFLAMNQFHPVDDYKRHVLGDNSTNVRRLFIHANAVKFRLWQLMERGSETVCPEGTGSRIWADLDSMIELFGYDIERDCWECAIETAHIFHKELVPHLEKFYRIIFHLTDEKMDKIERPKSNKLHGFGILAPTIVIILASILFNFKRKRSTAPSSKKKLNDAATDNLNLNENIENISTNRRCT